MALDFPNSPILNQTFTAPNGTIWLWDGVKWTAITSTSPYVGQGNVGRNLLHNPLFNVMQRGIGPFTTTAATTLDRWRVDASLDTFSFVSQAINDTQRGQIGDEEATTGISDTFTGNAGAGAFHILSQRIEGLKRLAGKTVTVSFWAAASATQKLGINILQNFGGGGSPSASVRALATGAAVTLSTTFQRYSTTIAVPTIIGKTVGTTAGTDFTGLELWFSCGATNNAIAGNVGVQSGTISIWGVQLEIGSVATPLEKPDPRYDLANCQRFYQASQAIWISSGGTAGGGIFQTINLPTTMRATPAVIATNTTSSNITGLAGAAYNGTSVYFSGSFTATGTAQLGCTYTASADL